ncbi:MAG: hypothetical protein FJ117_11850 [Deltaproteobacteria bacterium]|nr:hypothetical protein [Deltaproteobacteria bacterium]
MADAMVVFKKYWREIDGLVKSPVFVIARSSANAGRRSNPVFSRTYKNEIALLSLAMTLLPTFYDSSADFLRDYQIKKIGDINARSGDKGNEDTLYQSQR